MKNCEIPLAKTPWSKCIIHWRDEFGVNVSVVFTWDMPLARKLCRSYYQAGVQVNAGGPAVSLMPHYLADIADCGGGMEPLPLYRHNPAATFTTRGCIRQCPFCAVPLIEGEFRELHDWLPAPIVCDNNLLAASRNHFDRVIDRLKAFDGVDFNQGLDVRLLNPWHLDRLCELHLVQIRFAWDWVSMESVVMDAIDRTLEAGIPPNRINAYVLIGHEDTPEDALYRLNTLKAKGIKPNPMRYQPVRALQDGKLDYRLKKNSYVGPNWTAPVGATTDPRSLPRMMRYWSHAKVGKVPYEEFVG